MSAPELEFAHEAAVEIYGAFLDECVVAKVAADRIGRAPKESSTKIDGRPVRMATISGKGGWSPDTELAARWARHDNVSLLDHSLSVARGALMFWLASATRSWSGEDGRAEAKRIGHAVVCIAFLHDIDKDLGLVRDARIDAAAVEERMRRYGIDAFLARRGIRVSPTAMRNYIEHVEATQTAKTTAAADYDRRIASACPYIQCADKLDGAFAEQGVDRVRDCIGEFTLPLGGGLDHWKILEIHDHIHVFLLDRFQRALSSACKSVAGCLPLIETVHDGKLLCLMPENESPNIEREALERFLDDLPFGLRLEINNRLACKFVGGAASWRACRRVMRPGDWGRRTNLLALPREFARERQADVDGLFEAAGMETSWSPLDAGARGATAKPALDFPGGDAGDLDMEPAHALAFLAAALNHEDGKGRAAAPNAGVRERELRESMRAQGAVPSPVVEAAPEKDGRTRRVLLALWTVAEIWRLHDREPDAAQSLFDSVFGESGLVALWIDGGAGRPGIAGGVADNASDIKEALRKRFAAYLSGRAAARFDAGPAVKHCILCNEPVTPVRRVDSGSRAHGVKVSAFSGRDGRHDHLASPGGDTHLCPVCLAELQLRMAADTSPRSGGELPPLFSSPVTLGLFGGLAYERKDSDISLGLHDLSRLDIKKGRVYEGLDCQARRIRVARLETLPTKDVELIARLRMTLRAAWRLGRPIHIFRGAPRRHPAVFHFDAMPAWLEKLLGGNSLRIEQIPDALEKLELCENLASLPGLGLEWARQLADRGTELGALCVAWALSVDRTDDTRRERAWADIRSGTRERALALIGTSGGKQVTLKENPDPLVRLAWLATAVQKRWGAGASANTQLLCWKTAMDFLPAARRTISTDRDALVLGLAGTLEGELSRKSLAANRRHRDNRGLGEACVDFAEHFFDAVWTGIFRSRDPASRELRRAAAIYRFALLESYRERGIPETTGDGPGDAGRET